MSSRPSPTQQRATNPSLTVWGVRVAAVLCALSVLFQAFSASRVIVGIGGALDVHEAGAVVAHVVTGLLAIAAIAHRVLAKGPLWPAVLAAIVFVATFVEAALGHDATLWAHVPTAMLIMMGVTVLLAWAWWGTRRTA